MAAGTRVKGGARVAGRKPTSRGRWVEMDVVGLCRVGLRRANMNRIWEMLHQLHDSW